MRDAQGEFAPGHEEGGFRLLKLYLGIIEAKLANVVQAEVCGHLQKARNATKC